jgi:hypothetical protein
MLKYYNFWGIWQPSSLSRRHRRIAWTMFVMMNKVPLFFAILSFLQDETAYDYAKSSTLVICSIMNIAYIMTFLLCKKQVRELFSDFNKIFESRPDAVKYLNEELQRAWKIEKIKFTGLTLWLWMGIVSSGVFKDLLAATWQPECLKGNVVVFYIVWCYQAVYTIYLAYLTVSMHDFFFTFLRVMNACMKYLRDELKAMDLKGSEGKMQMAKCVDFHLDIRLQMRKYIKIVSFPIALHMLVGAYILGMSAMVISTHVSTLNYSVWEKLKIF